MTHIHDYQYIRLEHHARIRDIERYGHVAAEARLREGASRSPTRRRATPRIAPARVTWILSGVLVAGAVIGRFA